MEPNCNMSEVTQPPCLKGRQFPSDAPCMVRINSIEADGSLWVMLVSEEQIMEVISQALNENVSEQRVNDPIPHQVVSALNVDDTWYRAIVETVEPDIKVRFIDFGDTLVVPKDNLAPLPSTLSAIKPLAMKIQLSSTSQITPIVGLPFCVKYIGSLMDSVEVEWIQPAVAAVEKMSPDSTEGTTEPMQQATIDNGSGKTDLEESEVSPHLSTPESSLDIQVDSSYGGRGFECSTMTLPASSPAAVSAKIESGLDIVEDPAAEEEEKLLENISTTSFEPPANNSQESHSTVEPLEVKSVISSVPIFAVSEVDPDPLFAPSESTSGFIKTSSHKSLSTLFEKSPDIGSQVSLFSSSESSSEDSFKENIVESSTFSGTPTANGNELIEKDIIPTRSLSPGLQDYPQDSLALPYSSSESEPVKRTQKASQSTQTSVEAVTTSTDEECKPHDSFSTLLETQSFGVETSACIEIESDTGSINDVLVEEAANQKDSEKQSEILAPISALGHHRQFGEGYRQEKPGGAHSNGSNDKSFTTKIAPSPRIITKRYNEHSHSQCMQDLPPPPSQSPFGSYSHAVDSNQHMSSIKASSQRIVKANSPQDFKSVLEFELSIIREQNRLQMLQLQKKMEQSMASQIQALKDETFKQLTEFHNEVHGRLMVINDSVVHKLADIYSEITMLKNDWQMKRPATSKPTYGSSAKSDVNQHQNSQYTSITHTSNSGVPMFSSAKVHSHQNPQNHYSDYKNEESNQGSALFKSRNHHSRQVTNNLHEKSFNYMDRSNGLSNDRMETVTETSDSRFYSSQHHQPNPKHHSSDKHKDHPSSFRVGQFNSNSYPKVDYFDPSKTGLDNDSESGSSKSASGCIICVNNLLIEKINPDLLFNLFGVYGNVQRVKIMAQDKGRAYIEMGDRAQAEEAVRHLNKAPLMGQNLHVTPCSFARLNLTRSEFEANTCKDFTKPQSNLNRFKSFKWDAQKLFSPSTKLLITNVLNTVTDEKVKQEFEKKGFHIQSIHTPQGSNSEKKVLYVTMNSVEEAVEALMVMHLQELSDWVRMRITFGRPERARFLER